MSKHKTSKKQWLYYYNKNIDFPFEDDNPWTAMNHGATCCLDKHQTFYGAIMNSPQWQAWQNEHMRRRMLLGTSEQLPVFDIDECEGIGAISDEHLQEFFKFIKDL